MSLGGHSIFYPHPAKDGRFVVVVAGDGVKDFFVRGPTKIWKLQIKFSKADQKLNYSDFILQSAWTKLRRVRFLLVYVCVCVIPEMDLGYVSNVIKTAHLQSIAV